MNREFIQGIRNVHRVLAAYQQRVIETFSLADNRIQQSGFDFGEWSPAYSWRPPDQYNAGWTKRSAWDFQPLNSVTVSWKKGKDDQEPGAVHLLLEHVIDTSFEEAQISKNVGALNDPLGQLSKEEVADRSRSVWRARWVTNLSKTERISDQIWSKQWHEIYLQMYSGDRRRAFPISDDFSGAEAMNSELHIATGVLTLTLETLDMPEDVIDKLVCPMLAAVQRYI
jgi:hypothetical protein